MGGEGGREEAAIGRGYKVTPNRSYRGSADSSTLAELPAESGGCAGGAHARLGQLRADNANGKGPAYVPGQVCAHGAVWESPGVERDSLKSFCRVCRPPRERANGGGRGS